MPSVPQDFNPAMAPAPPAGPRRSRWTRPLNIACRTVHIAATGMLLGGHVFGAPAASLYLPLGVAIVTGAGLIALELYTTPGWAYQGCAAFVYVKLVLLCVVPFAWDYRVPILLAVVGLASVGSHATRAIRHYSFRFRRVMVGPTSSV